MHHDVNTQVQELRLLPQSVSGGVLSLLVRTPVSPLWSTKSRKREREKELLNTWHRAHFNERRNQLG
jgi:hypothetical protein